MPNEFEKSKDVVEYKLFILEFLARIGLVYNNQIHENDISKILILSNEFDFQDSEDMPAVNKAIYSKARKATIMSACLPGLGQIYNHKYNMFVINIYLICID